MSIFLIKLISPHLKQNKIKPLIADHLGSVNPYDLISSLASPCLPFSSPSGLSIPSTFQLLPISVRAFA